MGPFRLRRINLRLLIALAIIAILATAAYGFAASNTVGASRAGDGTGVVSGYNVSAVSYTLATDPTILAGVQFTLDNTATTVKVSLNNGGSWASCSSASPVGTWTCNVSALSAPVISLTQLRVVAVQ